MIKYRYELMCLSKVCQGRTVKIYSGILSTCHDIGNVCECPECGDEFKITENHIYVRDMGDIGNIRITKQINIEFQSDWFNITERELDDTAKTKINEIKDMIGQNGIIGYVIWRVV